MWLLVALDRVCVLTKHGVGLSSARLSIHEDSSVVAFKGTHNDVLAD